MKMLINTFDRFRINYLLFKIYRTKLIDGVLFKELKVLKTHSIKYKKEISKSKNRNINNMNSLNDLLKLEFPNIKHLLTQYRIKAISNTTTCKTQEKEVEKYFLYTDTISRYFIYQVLVSFLNNRAQKLNSNKAINILENKLRLFGVESNKIKIVRELDLISLREMIINNKDSDYKKIFNFELRENLYFSKSDFFFYLKDLINHFNKNNMMLVNSNSIRKIGIINDYSNSKGSCNLCGEIRGSCGAINSKNSDSNFINYDTLISESDGNNNNASHLNFSNDCNNIKGCEDLSKLRNYLIGYITEIYWDTVYDLEDLVKISLMIIKDDEKL